MQSPIPDQQQNDSKNEEDTIPLADGIHTSAPSPPPSTNQTEMNEPLAEGNLSENNGNEQQIVQS